MLFPNGKNQTELSFRRGMDLQPKRIYLSPPHLDGQEKQFLTDAFDSNWITTRGPHVEAFEQEMCARLGIAEGVALSSGTAALHLAMIILKIEKGDQVICSDFTFAATANAIRYCDATPVFIDSDRSSWNMDPALLYEELSQRSRSGKLPKAAIIVDIYGQCADYGQILEILTKFNVPVIEDAAQAVGASYAGKCAGTFGRMGVLSFNGNKIITTGGGGMLVSDNPDYIASARYFAAQARESVPHYEHKSVGYSYLLSNLLASVGRGQLQNLSRKVERRRQINAFYRRSLQDLPGINFMPEILNGRSTFWLTCLTIDPLRFGSTNEQVRLLLEKHNIESRHLWKPMHLQPVFRDWPFRGAGVSEKIFEFGLCLPSGSGLTEVDLERIVGVFKSSNKA
jgi:dTDP-4-amino-4,6-dideoxygalactose transaminase